MYFKTITLFTAILMLAACGKSDGQGDDKNENSAKNPSPTTTTAKRTPTTPGGSSGDHVAGEKVYMKTCLACHAANGRGNGGLTGADLIKDKTRLAKSDEELFKSVSEGKTGGPVPMPPQKSLLTPKEIRDSIAYIRHKFGN